MLGQDKNHIFKSTFTFRSLNPDAAADSRT